MRRLPLAKLASLAALLVVALTTAAPASAAITRKKAMWGPIEVKGVSQFPVYADLGVGIFEWRLDWNQVATRRPQKAREPRDPAYSWPAEIDRAVTEARRHGIQV